MKHEQSCGFAAEASSRVTGIPGVALATSGPGATNLLTAVGSCYFDSTACIFLTGQVNQNEMRKNPEQRQNGFQELDIVSMAKGITKFAYQIKKREEIVEVMKKAWEISLSGRNGPVLLDIPINIQQQVCERYIHEFISQDSESIERKSSELEKIKGLLLESSNPAILVGGGIRKSRTDRKFREFAENIGIPVLHSLMGKDILDTDSPLNAGMIGTYGNRFSNKILNEADLLLVLGSRLDVRQTGNSIESFRNGKKIVRIDNDETELSGRVIADINVLMELDFFFEGDIGTQQHPNSNELLKRLQEYKEMYLPESEQNLESGINPNSLCKWISQQFSDAKGYLVDVGQHQMWAAQSINLSNQQRFIPSGGMGARGFALPSAIGASESMSGKWIAVTGDGCLQLSIGELETLVYRQNQIAICVLNNSQHGMVAQFQDENMEGRYIGTREGYSSPNFSVIAKAFDIPSIRISNLEDLPKAQRLIKDWDSGPLLLEFLIPQNAKALPKMSKFMN